MATDNILWTYETPFMKKILITGGAGFIGSCLADKLMQNPNYKVVMVDNMLTGDKARLPREEVMKTITGGLFMLIVTTIQTFQQ